MKLYTIGFTKKTAKQFFSLLKDNHVKRIIDIRLNNKSQLAGFTKEEDLKYFLKEIAGIDYCHMLLFAPTDKMLKKYQNKELSWDDYQKEYVNILNSRDIIKNFDHHILSDACLLCSEQKPDKCHRRLLAEYLNSKIKDLEIIHI